MKVSFLEPLEISKEKLVKVIDEKTKGLVECTYYDDRNENPEVLLERSKDADIVVLSNMKYGRDIIEKLPNLKMICVAFTGVDLIDIEYCKERNINVCNCAGYSTVAVADLVFGFVVALSRNMYRCNEVVRQGGTKANLVGWELEGKRFGVIGSGAIGSRVLQIAQAFGCETVAYSRTPKDISGVTFMSMEDVLRTSDIVSIHVPQTAETIGLIGKEQIAMMKKDAILINCARGPIVDSRALEEALNENRLAGAGIDVFEQEPPIAEDYVLFKAKNLIATPHVAFASVQAFEKRAAIVGENIRKWIEGTPQNKIC
ncbi:MAG TPA: NAD(P)-dependent oxidoreductase [Lachnospiraceae bacterium]